MECSHSILKHSCIPYLYSKTCTHTKTLASQPLFPQIQWLLRQDFKILQPSLSHMNIVWFLPMRQPLGLETSSRVHFIPNDFWLHHNLPIFQLFLEKIHGRLEDKYEYPFSQLNCISKYRLTPKGPRCVFWQHSDLG